MKLSDQYDLQKIGKDILEISKNLINNPDFRKTIEIGGPKDIIALGDSKIEEAIEVYLTDNKIPVNLDGEEKRQRSLCKNPLGKITLDPIDGTDNFVDNTLHYCTILTIFNTPNPKTLGEAVWTGIHDHVSNKTACFEKNKCFFKIQDIFSRPNPLRINSIYDLGTDNYLKLFLGPDPRDTIEKLRPYSKILELSWRKNSGCAGYHFMEVAIGGREALIHPNQKPEELVAAIPLIESAGGAVLTFDGKRAGDLPYDFDKRYPIVAARTSELARDLVGLIN